MHVFEQVFSTHDINFNRNVFLYWAGKRSFKIIEILRNLIYLHSTNGIGYNVHLITLENIRSYIPDLPDIFFSLTTVQQSDYVRVNVIYKYGGIWLDSDTIVVNSLDRLFDTIDKHNSFFILQNNQSICNGVFGSKKDTLILKTWKEKIDCILQEHGNKLGPLALGAWILNRLTIDKGYVFMGLDSMYPITWSNCVDEFIKSPYINYKKIVRNFQPLVIIVNSVYRYLEKYSIDKILYGNMPINYFLNLSFQNLYNNNLHDYDFVEIGTSNFNTLIQTCNDTDRGISIEPVRYLYEELPDKPNIIKLNIGIKQTEGIYHIYYIPSTSIQKHKLPHFLLGCNSINKPHPLHIKYKAEHLCVKDSVKCLTISQLMHTYGIKQIKFLKIDTEGDDCYILQDLYNYIKYLPKNFYPRQIQLESNSNSSKLLVKNTIASFVSIGYKMIYSSHDTLLQL